MNQYLDTYQQPANDSELMPMPGESAGTQALQNLEQQAQAMGNAMKIAEAMCSTAMVPKDYRNKPADGAAAILYGAELGLNAIQSLQQIMVINGKPGIETRTAMALLKRHGYVIRTLESSSEKVTVEGVAPNGETEVSTWDMPRAKQAGYTSNKLYTQIPEQMLYAKAAMEVARKLAPDVLSGIAYSTEELQLQPVKATATRTDRAGTQRGGAGVMAAIGKAKSTTPEDTPKDPLVVAALLDAVTTAPDHEALTRVMTQVQDADLPDDQYQPLASAANTRWEELTEESQEGGQ